MRLLTLCLHSDRVSAPSVQLRVLFNSNVSIEIYFNVGIFHEMFKASALWFGYAGSRTSYRKLFTGFILTL